MVNQRHCPYCKQAARQACDHLALAVPGRDFVRRCIEGAQAHRQWDRLCAAVREQRRVSGDWSPDREDFTWLETAFCDRFLKNLRWFGALDHEWRTGDRLDKGCFHVLLWSKSPQRFWWELSEEIDRQLETLPTPETPLPMAPPELFSFNPRQTSFGQGARF